MNDRWLLPPTYLWSYFSTNDSMDMVSIEGKVKGGCVMPMPGIECWLINWVINETNVFFIPSDFSPLSSFVSVVLTQPKLLSDV